MNRLREVCFSFPAVEEKLSHGSPSFFVRGGKQFASFADDHHGDGRTAAWIKATVERQQELVAAAPERYFVPPYVGVGGWVGVHLGAATDWEELTILIEDGWSAVAPKSARSAAIAPPPSLAPRAKTDPAVAAAALSKLEAIVAGLPGAVVERDKWSASFKVKDKSFAWFLDNHHGDGLVGVWMKADKGENTALVARDPKAYFIPQYLGPKGWVGMRLDLKKVPWDEVAARLAWSHATVAPKPRKTKAGEPAKVETGSPTKPVRAPRKPPSRR